MPLFSTSRWTLAERLNVEDVDGFAESYSWTMEPGAISRRGGLITPGGGVACESASGSKDGGMYK